MTVFFLGWIRTKCALKGTLSIDDMSTCIYLQVLDSDILNLNHLILVLRIHTCRRTIHVGKLLLGTLTNKIGLVCVKVEAWRVATDGLLSRLLVVPAHRRSCEPRPNIWQNLRQLQPRPDRPFGPWFSQFSQIFWLVVSSKVSKMRSMRTQTFD